MIALRFPFGFKGNGRSATASLDDRIRQLIEQVLFTTPGERVNRPTFGSDLDRLVFTPNSDAAASVTQLTVQAALTQWVSDLVVVQGIDVVNEDAVLTVSVQYIVRDTQERRVVQVVKNG
jgi:phage baseplate assembly protein W